MSRQSQIYIKLLKNNQSNELCLEAVEYYGLLLRYIHKPTEEICLAAVQQCGLALKYVVCQNRDICLAAVKQHGHALHYVKNQTVEICWGLSNKILYLYNMLKIKLLKYVCLPSNKMVMH